MTLIKWLTTALLMFAAPVLGTISYVGGNYGTAVGTTVTCAIPAHSVGDLLVVWTTEDGAADTITVSGTETWAYQNHISHGTEVQSRLAYVIATGTSGFTATSTISGAAEGLVAICAAFDGVDGSTPFGVSVETSASTNTPSVTQTTGVTANSWAIVMFGVDRNGVGTPDTGYPTNTTGIHQRESGDGSGDSGASLAYDTTATSSEVYTWTALGRIDGTALAVYELLDEDAPPAGDQMMVIGAP